MGAWGYEPMDNDALEWLANQVGAPLLAAIKGAFQAYLGQTEDKDDVKTHEAIAAAALLADLMGDQTKMKYTDFRGGYFGYEARSSDLVSVALKVIESILEQRDWLSGWNEPERKIRVLTDLVSELRQIREEGRNR
jgi:Domain of unknown function (DUF4259)